MREFTIWFCSPTDITNTDYLNNSYLIPHQPKVTSKWTQFEKFKNKLISFPDKKLFFNQYAMPEMKNILHEARVQIQRKRFCGGGIFC